MLRVMDKEMNHLATEGVKQSALRVANGELKPEEALDGLTVSYLAWGGKEATAQSVREIMWERLLTEVDEIKATRRVDDYIGREGQKIIDGSAKYAEVAIKLAKDHINETKNYDGEYATYVNDLYDSKLLHGISRLRETERQQVKVTGEQPEELDLAQRAARMSLDASVAEHNSRKPELAALSNDAQIVHRAVERLAQERMADATSVERESVAEYTKQKLSDKEAFDGQVSLSPETRRIAMSADDFRHLVGEVNHRSVNAEAIAMREDMERKVNAASTMDGLAKLLDESENKQKMQQLASYPEQHELLVGVIERADEKLRERQRNIRIEAGAPPFVESQEAAEVTVQRLSRSRPVVQDDPPSFAERYIVHERDGQRFYYQADDGQLAIRASENRIQGMNREAQTIESVVDLAMARGWTDIAVRADMEMAREVWIEATARGLRVEGYRKPTLEDRQEVEQRRLARQDVDAPEIDSLTMRPERHEAPRMRI